MTRYYCPFCPSHSQLQIKGKGGVMICGVCGDPLVKVSLISFKKVAALIVLSSFIAPLLVMIFFFIKENTYLKNNAPSSLIPFSLLEKV